MTLPFEIFGLIRAYSLPGVGIPCSRKRCREFIRREDHLHFQVCMANTKTPVRALVEMRLMPDR